MGEVKRIEGGRGPDLRRQLWDREYSELRVIPSTSFRAAPSKALLLYEKLVDYSRLTPVLDAGCGNGRNSIYWPVSGATWMLLTVQLRHLLIWQSNLHQRESQVRSKFTTRS